MWHQFCLFVDIVELNLLFCKCSYCFELNNEESWHKVLFYNQTVNTLWLFMLFPYLYSTYFQHFRCISYFIWVIVSRSNKLFTTGPILSNKPYFFIKTLSNLYSTFFRKKIISATLWSKTNFNEKSLRDLTFVLGIS